MAKKIKKPKINVKKVLNDAGKALKKAGQDLKYAPVVPFIIPMRAMLVAKGVKPENDLGKLIKQFHSVIVQKNKSFDGLKHNLIDDVLSIVKDIVSFFAASKKKKEEGKKLTEDEKNAAIASDKVEAALPKEGGEKKSLYVTMGLGAAFLVVLFVVMRKK